ncbi:RdgB/HAM1 family non-canonical purine NTP pyrophosphatase [Rubinisphaera margarita]|uniref:RdgB/HAM1 family non-canonical purine NTP pyrophosphatase n=1 Tax=Rubinisphaera margarita TaxID=2909586 RepID=UPI001EE785DF|nr:RdgB/HAM1 family non-canonical purine NTP pyrophosphatase [Rubinisphaera margarita]MCG6157121.1 RdgB/HAM1 family non-canonical purine NTP pyrophosphatase [Rubinisphaera margarita]
MTEQPVIVLASRNAKKAAEIEVLLQEVGVSVRPVSEFPSATEVEEDGDSFQANAEKKASQVARQTGHWAIGEDSGLSVDALKGAPGIYSARYSGEGATDASNNEHLQQQLKDVPDSKRGAHYTCHVALADPTGAVRLHVERYCNGLIIREARGTNGFGYDPYFLIREYGKTFGELSPIVKKCISHRARAFHEFVPGLLPLLDEIRASK